MSDTGLDLAALGKPRSITEPADAYRSRHPKRTVVYRLFEEHLERYVREYEDFYEPREGPLRKAVPATVETKLASRSAPPQTTNSPPVRMPGALERPLGTPYDFRRLRDRREIHGQTFVACRAPANL